MNRQEFEDMKIGDKGKHDLWDVWRVPNGWIFAISCEHPICVFVPCVLNVEVKS